MHNAMLQSIEIIWSVAMVLMYVNGFEWSFVMNASARSRLVTPSPPPRLSVFHHCSTSCCTSSCLCSALTRTQREKRYRPGSRS